MKTLLLASQFQGLGILRPAHFLSSLPQLTTVEAVLIILVATNYDCYILYKYQKQDVWATLMRNPRKIEQLRTVLGREH